jgi:uncharacterized protein YjiS (DUF1127 family)
MKIIEAMKQIKDLQRKAEDLRKKVGQHCANLSFETPTYGQEQRAMVDGWLQAHRDIVQEILRLRVAIQRTNVTTPVTISLAGKPVTKTIAEWIHRRRDLAALDAMMFQQLGDRGLKEQKGRDTQGNEIEIRIVRYFDPKNRDERLEEFRSEPTTIDSTLEVVNAVTELAV